MFNLPLLREGSAEADEATAARREEVGARALEEAVKAGALREAVAEAVLEAVAVEAAWRKRSEPSLS